MIFGESDNDSTSVYNDNLAIVELLVIIFQPFTLCSKYVYLSVYCSVFECLKFRVQFYT